MMQEFVIQYGFCILLCAIGLFFVIMSYGAHFAGRSGVPFVGGFLIAVGFLISPVKWLALLGLIDYGYWTVPWFLIQDHMRENKFKAVFAEQGYTPGTGDDRKMLYIRLSGLEKELQFPYFTCHMYQLSVPKMLFAVCTDKTGRRFLLVDKCGNGEQIEIMEFDTDRMLLTGLRTKDTEMTVEIIVKDRN